MEKPTYQLTRLQGSIVSFSFQKEIGIRAVQNLVFMGITMFVAKKLLQWAVDAMDPTSKEKLDAQQRADKLLEQIGIQVR